MNRNRVSHPRWVVLALAVVAGLAAGRSALSATTFGVRTGVYTEQSAAFVGGEVNTSIASNWSFAPNLEVALANEQDVVTVNGDFHYDFFQDRPYWVWAGGGPAVIHRELSSNTDNTSLGVNFLGGIAWRTDSKVAPYLQGKVTLSNDDEAVLAFGVRF
jgi:hypothetical protein